MANDNKIMNRAADNIRILAASMVEKAKSVCDDVEFTAVDATRAEKDFLKEAIATAVKAGATCVTLCDDAAILLPDDFAAFVKEMSEHTKIPIQVN